MPEAKLKKTVIHEMYKKAGIHKKKNTKRLYEVTDTYFKNIVYQVYISRNLSTNRITLRSIDVILVQCIRGEK